MNTDFIAMRSVSILSLLVMAAACSSKHEPIEKLPAPTPTIATLDPSLPPPPPPPPPQPGPVPPPQPIMDFVKAHSEDPGTWRVQLREPRGRATRAIPDEHVQDLILRLTKDTTYTGGEYGCVGDPLDILVSRGSATLALTDDCGNLYMTSAGQQAPVGALSHEMVDWIDALRAKTFH